MRPAASLPLVTVMYLCLITIGAALDHTYRGSDGHLGRTVPAWQEPIIAGTAPAPYVYRQGVPRARQAIGAVLKPGHAALVLDLLLAAVALGAALTIVRSAASPLDPLVAPVGAALAILGSLPSDKPEAVAVVALSLVITAALLRGALVVTIAAASLAALVRPEIPIVVALALLLAAWRAGSARPPGWIVGAGVALVVGAGYLACARWVLWPDAAYPPGTDAVTLVENLALPRRWPGVVAASLLIACFARWAGAADSARAAAPPAESVAGTARLAIAAMQVGLLVACLCLGRADELRLLMPSLAVAICVGATPLPRRPVAPADPR